MIDKKTASRLYAMNQMGMGPGGPKRPKKNKEQEVSMSCSEHGCSAYDSGGGGSNAGSSSYKGGSSSPRSGSKGEKNKVMSKRQAEKRAVKFAENRAKAAQPKKMKAKF